MKTYTLKSPKAGRRPVTLPDLIAREHARIVKLTNSAEAIRRKLASARLRYATYNRMALDAERRAIMLPGLPASGSRPEPAGEFAFEPRAAERRVKRTPAAEVAIAAAGRDHRTKGERRGKKR